MPTRPTVWIPHIPRTGGTSRRKMMFHLSEYCEYEMDVNFGIPNTDHIVTGHHAVLENPDWIKILFVRDPLQRFWSSYYWTLKHHPDLALYTYTSTANMEEPFTDYRNSLAQEHDIEHFQPFCSTETWMKEIQKRGGQIGQVWDDWDYIFSVNELDKFSVVMNELGYAVNEAAHLNSNNIGHTNRPLLSRPHGPELRKEYKYYNKLGLNY
jgi:hypothetical protein